MTSSLSETTSIDLLYQLDVVRKSSIFHVVDSIINRMNLLLEKPQIQNLIGDER